MKNIILTLCIVVFSLNTFAQTNLPAFNKIYIDEPVNIELIASGSNKIDASAINDKVTATVENSTLSLEMSSSPKLNQPVKIYFTELNEIKSEGIAVIKTAKGTTIKSDELLITHDGAGKFVLNTDTKILTVKAEGAGSIELSGVAENFDVKIDGVIKLNAKELITKESRIDADGACNFEINVSDKLDIAADGMVKGFYSGNPAYRNIKIDGLSKIKDVNSGTELSDERNINPNDTTKIKLGKHKIIIVDPKEKEESKTEAKKRKELKNVYAGFELGMQSFSTPELNFNMPASYSFLNSKPSSSWFFGINLFEGDAHIIKNKLALTTGAGMEFFNIGMDGNRRLLPNSNVLQADSNTQALSMNRLYNFNLNVPLLIKFAPNTGKRKNNGFHFAAGVIGTYVAHIHTRTESTANGYEEMVKTYDDFNVNPFRLTATVRAGYGWFRFFANYSLTPYFKRSNTGNTGGNAPDIRMASVGLTLIPF